MARIHEYQGKEVLKNCGIPVPRGMVAQDAEEAKRYMEELGKPAALKAQVLTTGRYKAGGIKFASDPEEAANRARELFDTRVRGLQVDQLLVEEKLDIKSEYYLGIIINNSHKVKSPTLILSSRGGVDVEEIASSTPEKIAYLNVDYLQGVGEDEAEKILGMVSFDEELSGEAKEEMKKIISSFYQSYMESDARIAEINPLVLTQDGRLLAGDCRFTIDDNSDFRQTRFGIRLPRDMDRSPTELEYIAWTIEEGDFRGTGYFTQMVPEIDKEGYIGFHGIGGGGAMLAASALVNRNFKIANYTDTSGDPPASKVYRVVKCIFSQPIEGYALMGACLANQEQWHHAHALVKILREEAENRPGFPVVLLLAGNREKETHDIIEKGLKDANLRWELYGRQYIYNTDYIAERIQKLVEDYREEQRR